MADAIAASGAAQVQTSSRTKAQAAAREFEAVFAGQMAKLMLESVGEDATFGGGHGEEMFKGVLAEQLGNAIARGRGVGLAPQVLDEIIKLQGRMP